MECKGNRIDWIDFAKGVTIILVIAGHSLHGLPRAIIFSFHMPLFFILNGASFSFSDSRNAFIRKVDKSFKHLIPPVIYVFAFITIYQVIFGVHGEFSVGTFLYKKALTLAFASGTSVELGSLEIDALGVTWFLVVLFLSRSIFDFIHLIFKGKGPIVSILLSFFGVIISKVTALPLSFDIALTVLPLFYVGKAIIRTNLDKNVTVKFLISLFSWLFIFWVVHHFGGTYLELAHRNYPLFPVCFIGAILGTASMCFFCAIGCRYALLKPLLYIGKNSFALMIIHALENQLIFGWWEITASSYCNALFRVIVDLFVFCIFTLLMNLWSFRITCFRKK